MLAAFDDCADEQLRLVNEIFRLTGIRSGSLVLLMTDWVRKLQDGYVLDLKERKGGTRLYSVPLPADLGRRMMGTAGASPRFVILPEGSPEQRRSLVKVVHNRWLKTAIGAGSRGQGNHRLRDTVATALMKHLGMEIAAAALGHEDVDTTKRHYARCFQDFPARYLEELRHFERLRPGNVVTMKVA